MTSSYLASAHVHPLFFHTIACALGIISQVYLPSHTSLILAGGISMILLAVACNKKNYLLSSIALFFFFFIAGGLRYYYQQKNHLNIYHSVINKPCRAQGVVSSIDYLSQGRSKWRISLNLSLISCQNQKIYTNKSIQFYVKKKPDVWVQDLIQVDNVLIKKIPHASYNSFLIKENIIASLFIPSFEYQLIQRPKYSFDRWLFNTKQQLLWKFKSKLTPQTFAFFSSVFLGHRLWGKKEMEEPKDNCKSWGISHYLARSGLHMVIFIYGWHILINMFPLSRLFKDLFLIILSCIYYLLSWSSISFIRAFISFILYKICHVLKVQPQLLHLLTIVTLSVLLINPMQIFFLDFQLSFGLTFALAWFNNMQTHKQATKS